MELNVFLDQFNQLHQQNVYIFSGKKYSALFFALFLQSLKKNNVHVVSLDLESITFDQIKMHLSTSFLGQKKWYWLGNISEWSDKDQRLLMQYMLQYTGIHQVGCFIKQTDNSLMPSSDMILLPTHCNQEVGIELIKLFEFSQAQSSIKLFIKKMFSCGPSYSLDTVCLLLNYADVISRPMQQEFFDNWFHGIARPEKSLFSLSGYFFARQVKSFFKLWHSIKDDYTIPFWISFWSDQLFRASLFCNCMRSNDMVRAKKAAFRLPFSFTKQNWKRFYAKQLIQLHQELYQLDFEMKNGLQEQRIDCFLIRYFSMN